MRPGRRFGLGSATVILAGGVVALMLIPAGDSEVGATRALSTSPELTRYLDNAVSPPPVRILTPAPVAVTETASPPDADPLLPPGAETGVETADAEVPPAEPRELTTTRTALNMREGPSTSNPTVSVLRPDEKVEVLERSGSWARVQRTDGASGWVYASYLGSEANDPAPRQDTPVREASADAGEKSDDVLASLRLRSSPSTRARTIVMIEPGTALRVAERRPGWVRVIMPDGLTGWVRTTTR